MGIHDGPIRHIKNTVIQDMVEAADNGFCPICREPIVSNSFKDEISKREYEISGMCQQCQDLTFEQDDEEDNQ